MSSPYRHRRPVADLLGSNIDSRAEHPRCGCMADPCARCNCPRGRCASLFLEVWPRLQAMTMAMERVTLAEWCRKELPSLLPAKLRAAYWSALRLNHVA